MKIKRNKTDAAFSLAIREAHNFTCQCCGKVSDERNSNGYTDCAHNFSRTNKLIRWNVHNATCLCRTCHMRMTSDPDEHVTFFKRLKGEEYYNMRDLRNSLQKVTKKDEDAILLHYKKEIEKMRHARKDDYRIIYKLENPKEIL